MKSMFQFLAGSLLAFAWVSAVAQGPLPVTAADAERARIRAERAAVESRFAAEEAACRKKFVVTDCVKDARARRRDALGDLRRQDISLNDADRKRKAAEQVRRIEQKSEVQRQQDAVDRRAEAHESLVGRLRRSEKKAEDKAAAQESTQHKGESGNGRLASSEAKAASRVGKSSKAAEAQRKYDEKLRQAEQRKAEAQDRQQSRSRQPAKALPVPQ
jgi:hypothetical protein